MIDFTGVLPVTPIFGRKKEPREVFDENMKKAKKLYESPKRWKPSVYKKLQKHIEKAIEISETVEVDQEDLVWLWSVKGSVFYMGYKSLDEALECYDKALSINPRDFVTLVNKLNVLYGMGGLGVPEGKLDEFIHDCDTALELINEARKQLSEGQGPSIVRSGMVIPRTMDFSGVEFLDHTESLLWSQKGGALKGSNRIKEALRCFDRALEINPKNWIPLSGKGSALYDLERYEEALEYINKSLEYGPKRDARGEPGSVPSDIGMLLNKVRILGTQAGRDLYELSEQRPEEWTQKEGKVEEMHEEIDLCLASALNNAILERNPDKFLLGIVEVSKDWKSRRGLKASFIKGKVPCKFCGQWNLVIVAPLYWGKNEGWGYWFGSTCPHNKLEGSTSVRVFENRREELARWL